MNQLQLGFSLQVNLLIYSGILFIVLSMINRSLIHAWLGESIAYLFLFYATVYRSGSIIARSIGGVLILALIIWRLLRAMKGTTKKDINPKFICVIGLFTGSYLIGINTNIINLAWFTGFILASASFIIGIFLYRKRPKKISDRQ